MDRAGDDVELLFQSDHLTNYRVLHKQEMSDPNWTVRSTVAGDGTVKSLVDSASLPRQFYLVETIR